MINPINGRWTKTVWLIFIPLYKHDDFNAVEVCNLTNPTWVGFTHMTVRAWFLSNVISLHHILYPFESPKLGPWKLGCSQMLVVKSMHVLHYVYINWFLNAEWFTHFRCVKVLMNPMIDCIRGTWIYHVLHLTVLSNINW